MVSPYAYFCTKDPQSIQISNICMCFITVVLLFAMQYPTLSSCRDTAILKIYQIVHRDIY